MKITHVVVPTLSILSCLLSGDVFGQACAPAEEMQAPVGNDLIEVSHRGGRMGHTSTFWITAEGNIIANDYRGKCPLAVSVSTSRDDFRELLALASKAQEADRQWRDDNPDGTPSSLNDLLEWVQAGQPGPGRCMAHNDGVDTSVSISISGQVHLNECVGVAWADFRRRFFEIFDDASEPASE